MSQTHTPGPWIWVKNRASDSYRYLHDEAGPIVLAAEEDAGSSWVEIQNPADADLIAAAPELLQAIKEEMEWIRNLPIPTPGAMRRLLALRDVVAKTDGVSALQSDGEGE